MLVFCPSGLADGEKRTNIPSAERRADFPCDRLKLPCQLILIGNADGVLLGVAQKLGNEPKKTE